MQGYERDPRSLAKRAEAYLKSTGIADRALFGPENEFFIFDNVRYGTTMSGSFFEIDSIEAAWSSGKTDDGRQQGASSGREGRLLPGAAGRFLPGLSLGHVPGAGGAGPEGRSASPRSRDRRPVRDRRQRQHARPQGRRSADPQVRHPQRRACLRQDGDVHAEADRRRQRQRHARAPVDFEGRQAAVRR